MKIQSIEIIDVDCDVYDIEVEVDHSYVVCGCVLHNCSTCYAAESENPYELGKSPKPALHPRCRCVLIPHIGDMTNERPYVKDDRSVKDIPKDERAGKIGQTRDNIEQFFSRLPDSDMRAYLGKSRYELWKAGKIDSLKDLVDSRTLRPLRLDELP